MLNRLVDQGNTVVVIEHNLDVIKTSDRIIDLGPEGGEEGGSLVAQGTPEQVAATKDSYTGHFLSGIVKPAPARKKRAARAEGPGRGLGQAAARARGVAAPLAGAAQLPHGLGDLHAAVGLRRGVHETGLVRGVGDPDRAGHGA